MVPKEERPPLSPDGLRHWRVVSGVLEDHRGVLMVQNQRRDGRLDWSTPGGVVDRGEGSEEALSREVVEETGLKVSSWSEPVYRVEVVAVELGFHLHVETRRAHSFTGQVVIDQDPDGIVVDSAFVDLAGAAELLGRGPRWVAEPLLSHLRDGVDDGRTFAYRIEGKVVNEETVSRVGG